jgi:hypothetical protein
MFFPGTLMPLAAQWFSRVEAKLYVAHLRTTSLDSRHSRLEKLAGSCTILSRWRAAYQQVGLLLVRDSVGHQNPDTVWTFIGWPTWLVHHRGKTVTKPLPLSLLGLPLSEKQIPQVAENLESGEYSRFSPDRMSPFSAFLAEISASGRVFANRALAATSMDVLNRAMQRLFDRSAKRDS